MPCTSGLPTKEEEEFAEEYKNNPIFKREVDKYRFLIDNIYEDKRKLADKLANRESISDLENIAFLSFMTVFLCKAMNIIKAKDLMGHTYTDMEWWYEMHKFADINKGKFPIKRIEIIERLYNINNKYKVDKY